MSGFRRPQNFGFLFRLAPRQGDRESGAFAEPAVHFNGPVHQLHESFGNRQADPGTLDIRFFGTQAVERLEQVAEPVIGNADAGIRHTDADSGFPVAGGIYFDGPAGLVVFDGIGHQVEQYLLEPYPVGIDKQIVMEGNIVEQLDIVFLRHGSTQGDQFLGQIIQIDVFERQGEMAGFDPGQIENFIDQFQKVLARFQYFTHALLLIFRQRFFRVGFHELSET